MTDHLKRYNAPNTWQIEKKKYKYITKPVSGSHSLETSLPLVVLFRDMLNFTQTRRETKKLLSDKKVLVNDKVVQDYRLPIGLFDVISLPDLKEHFMVLFNESGKLFIKKVSKEQAENKAYFIKNKTTLKENKIQLNLYNGYNLIVPKDSYKVGDSIVLHGDKVVKHLKMDKGAMIFIVGGKYIGKVGIIEEIKSFKGFNDDRIIFKHGKEKYETLKEYAFVIEKSI